MLEGGAFSTKSCRTVDGIRRACSANSSDNPVKPSSVHRRGHDPRYSKLTWDMVLQRRHEAEPTVPNQREEGARPLI